MFKNLYLLLQTLHYDGLIFLRKVYTSHGRRLLCSTPRQAIDYTPKMKGILILSCLFFLLAIVVIFLRPTTISLFLENPLYIQVLSIMICTALYIFLFPFCIVLANACLGPLQYGITKYTLAKATHIRSARTDLIVIGIVGSYGKTSMKELLLHLLQDHIYILTPSGNINTPLGLARLLLNELKPEHTLLIMELGETNPGDITELCTLLQPTHGIITGATLQHAETLGTYIQVLDTLCEILPFLHKNNGTLIYNADIQDIATKITPSESCKAVHAPDSLTYIQDFGGISFGYHEHIYTTKLLAGHTARSICIALEMITVLSTTPLGVSLQDIYAPDLIKSLEHVSHRMQPLRNERTGVLVIDDSYNGNIEGVKSICQLLQHQNSKGRKIYMTPGLIELGTYNYDIHFLIGTLLAGCTDMVLLIQGEGYSGMMDGLMAKGYDKDRIRTFATTKEAHASLGGLLKSGDVIVFQNDVPDMLG